MTPEPWKTVMVGECHTYRRGNLVVWHLEDTRKWAFKCMACNVVDESRDTGQQARAAASIHRMHGCEQGRNF